MAEKSISGVVIAVIAAVSGIVGAVSGAVAHGLMNAYVQEKERRARAVLESFQFDQTQSPVEVFSLKQFVDEMRNLSIMRDTTVRSLAEVHRAHPGCANVLSDVCRPVFVQTIELLRDELGSGHVLPEDIDLLLRPKYEAAMKALEKGKNK